MPRGQLIINNKDAFTEWGVSLSNGAKATLMAPLALKQSHRPILIQCYW